MLLVLRVQIAAGRLNIPNYKEQKKKLMHASTSLERQHLNKQCLHVLFPIHHRNNQKIIFTLYILGEDFRTASNHKKSDTTLRETER
jgi:hypothetical protein